ncbi:MAG: LysR family transcriptional regulator [Burkholderiaceae bacterium]|nr:LysR family transcriptional regulator [Rhodoferax sp.]MCB2005932.1 LysR family transcriptional regulator [Rhodoferax sp.]MCB2030489.1 LysR family transcriptional regulator [Rhodoferax sp.]MCB2042953.1 LysR family transcriptional regulator [Rhodoferax sp.]MCP5259867.1 LysR family transcriptional regulator [Rhodoferax sp.]
MTERPAAPRSLGRRVRFSQLEMVLEVADTGSLGEASRRLHLSRAAVSKALKELERTLEQELFLRSPKGMVPTAAGLRVAGHARLLVNDLRHLAADAAAAAVQRPTPLRIGMPTFVAEHVAPPILQRLATAGQRAVTLREGRLSALIEMLLKGEIDALLALYAPRAVDGLDLSQLEIRPVAELPIVVVASPAWKVPARRLRWDELLSYPWILPPASTHLRRSLDEMFTARGVQAPAEVLQSGSLAANVQLASVGLGLAVVPLKAAQIEIDAGRLSVVHVRPALPPTYIALMYRKVSAIYLDALRLLQDAVVAR